MHLDMCRDIDMDLEMGIVHGLICIQIMKWVCTLICIGYVYVSGMYMKMHLCIDRDIEIDIDIDMCV